MSVVESSGTELEVIEHRPLVHVAPDVTASELVTRLAVIEDAMRNAMKQDVDYGVIPGTGTKPTLLKPGAEKLGALFQLDVQLENEKIWHDDGHLTVICRATVYHQPTGTRLGSGEGICTTKEAKYAFRKAERVCPHCGVAAIIKGKAEYGGGWICWKKKDGCDVKFADGDQAIEGQEAGKVANENIADTYNTVDKMASKRARIDAVLAVTGASALFTQDIEDFVPAGAPKAVRHDGDTEHEELKHLENEAATRSEFVQPASVPPAAPESPPSGWPEFRFASGKYQGKSLAEVPVSYLDWYAESGPKQDVKDAILSYRIENTPNTAYAGDDDIPFMPSMDGTV